LKPINGKLPATVNMIRTVAGLALPVTCYFVQGIYIGSCTHYDFCEEIFQNFWGVIPSNCPPEFEDYGIPCSCPFNIPDVTIEENLLFEIADLSTSNISFMASGDFDLKVVFSSGNQHIGCFRFLFTIQKAYPISTVISTNNLAEN
jgi:hypothetical protein